MFAIGPAVRTTLGRTVTRVDLSEKNRCRKSNLWRKLNPLRGVHKLYNDIVTVRPRVVRTAGPKANIAGVPVIVE